MDMNGAGRPGVQARACMHRIWFRRWDWDLGRQQGPCMHPRPGRRRGSRARANSLRFGLKPMGDGKNQIKAPAMQGRRTRVRIMMLLHIHEVDIWQHCE